MGPKDFLTFVGCVEELARPHCKPGRGAVCHGQGELLPCLWKLPEVDQQQAEMEPHGLRVREAADERAEPGERESGTIFVVQPNGGGDPRIWVIGREARGRSELACRGDRPKSLLEGDPTREEELRARSRLREARDERREAGRRLGVKEIVRAHGRRRVGLHAFRRVPGVRRAGGVAAESQRDTELDPDERAVRMLDGQ